MMEDDLNFLVISKSEESEGAECERPVCVWKVPDKSNNILLGDIVVKKANPRNGPRPRH